MPKRKINKKAIEDSSSSSTPTDSNKNGTISQLHMMILKMMMLQTILICLMLMIILKILIILIIIKISSLIKLINIIVVIHQNLFLI